MADDNSDDEAKRDALAATQSDNVNSEALPSPAMRVIAAFIAICY